MSWGQTEVDFGDVGVSEGIFTIPDPTAYYGPNPIVLANVAYEAPTGKDLDEIEMDNVIIKGSLANKMFTFYIKSSDGSYLHGKFKINYMVAYCNTSNQGGKWL